MALGDVVKVVLVRLRTDGAAAAKEQMAAIAEQARAIGRLDPTIKFKVDKDAALQLRQMRLQLSALKLTGDSAGLQTLANELRALGAASDDPRVRLRALGLQMEALRGSVGSDKEGGGGLLGSLLMLIGRAGGGGAAGLIAGGGVAGAMGLAGVAGAALGIIPALVAAGAGLAAFGALAYPTFQRLTGAISTVIHAVSNYQAASQNLDTAIRKSPADWAAYQKAIQGVEPDLRAAAQLLTNQNVTWQQLTPSMQKAVTALANNKAELKALLPDQRAALAALLKQRDAWDNLTPAQQKAAASALSISKALSQMQQAVAPLVMTVINDLLQIANQLLPAILPLATTAGNALVGIFGNLANALKLTNPHVEYFRDRFGKIHDVVTTTTTPFGEFVKKLTALSGPAITAIGNGIGQIAAALGKLLIALVQPSNIHAMSILFGAISGIINALAWFFSLIAHPHRNSLLVELKNLGHWFEIVRRNVVDFARNVKRWFEDARRDFDHMTATIMTWAHDVARWFDDARHRARVIYDGMRHEIAHIWDMIWNNTIGRIERGISDAVRWFHGMPGRIVHAVGDLGKILFNAGKAVITGFWDGLKSAWSAVSGWLSSIGGWISSLKGPLDKDAALLRPHGRAIMTGLAMGMNDGLPDVRAQIARTTGTITGGGYGGYGGGGALRIQWVGGPSGALEQAMWTWFRERVRITGGGGPQSVQRALGQVWR